MVREKRLVLGVLADVDAGKTTLCEDLFFHAGKVNERGRVDYGNAFLDNDPLEKERGITITAHGTYFSFDDTTFSLLDTPGHVDFSAETARTLGALDVAILVISASDGVTPRVKNLWEMLRVMHIPTFVFVNKMDLIEIPKDAILTQINDALDEHIVDFSSPDNDAFYETLALENETWLGNYLETGVIDDEKIAHRVAKTRLFPCYFGAALRDCGIDALALGLCRFTLMPAYPEAFGATVIKILHDEKRGRLTRAKITGGALHTREIITYHVPNDPQKYTEKITALSFPDGAKDVPTPDAVAGTVVDVAGLSHTYAGQGLGTATDITAPIAHATLHYGVILPEKNDPHQVLEQLRELEEEDPSLCVTWDNFHRQIQVALHGDVQKDVLAREMKDRFGVIIDFDTGHIAYRETIEDTVEGVGHYEPLRHYAEVHLLLEPLARGEGLQLATRCPEDNLAKNWQRLVMTHLAEKTHRGVLIGAPITDMRITLVVGRAHLKHTEGGDFREATYRAVRQGLRQAKSVLLEPQYAFTLELPTAYTGRALVDLERMAAQTDAPVAMENGWTRLTGVAPVSGMHDYGKSVTGYTAGNAHLELVDAGYAPCANSDAVIASSGYDPDRDVANTADSVFCKNGAGYNVAWYDVKEKMHLPRCLTFENVPEEKAPPIQKRVAGYVDSLAEDKELLAIFERTYGPVRRDKRYALDSPPKDSPKKNNPVKSAPVREEYLVVDGYNIIFSWDELQKIARENLDAARAQLVEWLCNYHGVRGGKLLLVFDAYRVPDHLNTRERVAGIEVVYTAKDVTADSYIERLTQEESGQYRLRVASSDGAVQTIVVGNDALRVSAREFHEEVMGTLHEIGEYVEGLRMKGKNVHGANENKRDLREVQNLKSFPFGD